MRYRLRYQQHDLELTVGTFLIGRSTECHISLDDPLASRQHAQLVVERDTVFVEDLGSRNGVRVNGEKIAGRRALTHGDRIAIGSQEMVLLRHRETRTDTIVQSDGKKGESESFAVLAVLADKAIALKHGEEAERLLEPYLRQVLASVADGGEPDASALERAADYAVKLAALTGKGTWADYVFELYSALGRPCPAAVVDGLYTALRKVRGADVNLLRKYIAELRSGASALGPAERFLVNRLEGLGRLLGLK
jgi:pSer/pThr/pTyr-binding forkhead associated (FHA) protein